MTSKNRSREGRSKRGFAAMDPEARREISKRGGEASHESGRGHEFSSEEAREAGRRGGEARWGSRAGRTENAGEEAGRTSVRSAAAGDGDELSSPRGNPPRDDEEEERFPDAHADGHGSGAQSPEQGPDPARREPDVDEGEGDREAPSRPSEGSRGTRRSAPAPRSGREASGRPRESRSD
jgi:general stress protein YciG